MSSAFITIEGIDGSGKTTQARLLVEWLRELGREPLATREPGGTPAGERIREIVLSPQWRITPEAELFLYLADRAIHVAETVRPALAAGRVVVCERYTHSTLAYQGYGRGLDLEFLRRLNAVATGDLEPDLVLVLDLAAAHARLDAGRLDRLELEGGEFLDRVASGFRHLASANPERVKTIDATGSVEAVHRRIAGEVRESLERRPASSPTEREDR